MIRVGAGAEKSSKSVMENKDENIKKERDFYQISLKLLLKNNEGKILALKAIDDGTYSGYYDLPGGRIDTDEFRKDFSEILRREAMEEIGDVTFQLHDKPVAIGRHLIPAGMTSAGKDIHVLYLFFLGKYTGGNVTISSEHTEYVWLDLDTIDLGRYFKSGILEGIRMYIAGEF